MVEKVIRGSKASGRSSTFFLGVPACLYRVGISPALDYTRLLVITDLINNPKVQQIPKDLYATHIKLVQFVDI